MTWLDDLAENWMPGDPVTLSGGMRKWLELRHAVVTRLKPRSIVEIGVRAGYSAFAMLSAAPGAAYHGIDIRTDAHGGFVGAHEHAETLLGRFPDVSFLHADSRELAALHPADLIHIDGDHSYEGCMWDLALARSSGIRWALVDDTEHVRAVPKAVRAFCEGHGFEPEWIHEGHRGAALVRMAE